MADDTKHGRKFDYECGKCHKKVPPEKLVARRVVYTTVSKPVRTVRSRTTGWQCEDCCELDTEYMLPPYATAPGHVGTAAEENHSAQG